MTKEEKTRVIEELVEKLNNTTKIYLADCSSLSVEKVNQLRKKCFENGVSMHVVKNTLLEKAIERANDKNLKELLPTLKGATTLMISESSAAPAKLIKEFRAAGNEKPILKGAYVEETIYIGDAQLNTLATIKSKNELIADVIALLKSPAQRVLSQIEENAKKKEAA
jgi:large subunit ribosomal protein L10